ncbi:Rieske (2Fe-2S) protein [Actinoallomurus sp. NBC_01490]|uniref:Rieske (2Fe-2S) protein n=1 Tax=Actinoallomurus sp. NBC_01490 TaxID=2903557 RepID=UPI002E315C61|nr:Rieske (2Fe-2S) protein [Actinoallomurus sp. NBC_01490]
MDILNKLEDAEVLDRVVEPTQKVARRLPRGPVRDTLHGTWLGHPVHPMLVQASVGAWLSAGVLDLWRGGDDAARRLAAFGLLISAPAVLAGTADWSEQHEQQMRVGVVHALANGTAIGLYGASLLARTPARRRALRYAGLGVASIGALLGGRLSFRQAGGVNHAEPVPHLVEPGWHDLGTLNDLPDGRPVRRMLGEVPLLVLRRGEDADVLADRCSHLSGPLSDGEISDGCVTCPWHGSVFRLSDGSVARGPATAPQPVFETEVRDGVLRVRLPGAG